MMSCKIAGNKDKTDCFLSIRKAACGHGVKIVQSFLFMENRWSTPADVTECSGQSEWMAVAAEESGVAVTIRSTEAAKIALFRRRFAGRVDMWARRFESKGTGKSGYHPVCSNEWVRGVCD